MIRIVLCCIGMLLLFSCNPIEKKPLRLQVIVQDRIGFIDASGQIRIKPVFRAAGDFSEGLACARINGYYGFIDERGVFVIPEQYDYAYDFSEGLALVYKDAHPFFIDSKGRKVIDCPFAFAESFEHGIAKVKTASGKYGFINKKGTLVIDTVFAQYFYFVNGLAVATGLHDNPYSTADKPQLCYESALLDTSGNIIIPFGKYKQIQDLRNGYYLVKLIGEEGPNLLPTVAIVDAKGAVVFQAQQQKGLWINNFACGLIGVSLHLPGAQEYGDTDYYYNHVYPAFMNLKGELVIDDTNMHSLTDFSANRAFVNDLKLPGFYMINTKGERMTKPIFQSTEDWGFHNGNILVKVDGLYGLIDTNGNFLLPAEYVSLSRTIKDEGVFVFSKKMKSGEELYGLINSKGTVLIKPQFQMIDRTGMDNGILKARYEGKMSYVNTKAEVIWQHEPSRKQVDTHLNTALTHLNIDYKLEACFAAASEARQGESRGYATYANFPKPLSQLDIIKDQLLAVVVQADVKDTFNGKYNGIKVIVYNNDNKAYLFAAIDSRLNMITQAKDKNGEWRDIEELASSFCGNSYHTLTLKPKEYWHFAAPEYEGAYTTKLRIVLKYYNPKDENLSPLEAEELSVYSNEYEGSINPAQLWRSGQYKPRGLVNPYYYGED